MVQILESDLTFAYGTPNYGTNYAQLIGVVPTTSSGYDYGVGNLHDGYASAIGKPCVAPVASTSGASSSDSCYCFMTGQWHLPDQRVQAIFRTHPISGTPYMPDWAERVVMARIQGGTVQGNGTTDVRYEDVTCYMFRCYITEDSSFVPYKLHYELLRLNSGTVTVLGTKVLAAAGGVYGPVGLAAPTDSTIGGAPVGLRLVVDGDGTSGDPVTLTASVTEFGTDGTPASSAEVIFSGITDTSGSKITSFGRVGFGMGTARDGSYVTGVYVDLCESLILVNEATSATTFRDEFVRVGLSSLDSADTDYAGVTGKFAQGRFSRDQFGPVDSGRSEIMQRNTGAQSVWLDLDSTDEEAAVLIDHRPVTDTTRQRRKCLMTVGSTSGTYSIGGGIVLYANQTAATTSATGELGFTNLTGYAAVCKYTQSTDTYTVSVYRYGTDYANKLIAQKSDVSSGAFSLDSSFTFEFEAYPTDNQGGYPDASVTLIVRIGGAQVALSKPSGAGSSITVTAAGTVIDNDSTRVRGGPCEGLYVCGDTSGALVTVDNWQVDTLHDPVTPPSDQTTIVVNGEGTASTSLDDVVTPAWAVDMEYQAPTVSIPLESGHRYSCVRFTDTTGALFARRIWRFTSPPMTEAEHTAALDFFAARAGVEEAFNFTDPYTGDVVKVAFLEDSFGQSKVAHGTYRLTAAVQELV